MVSCLLQADRRTADEVKIMELLHDRVMESERLTEKNNRLQTVTRRVHTVRSRGGGSCLKCTFFKFHQHASLEELRESIYLIFADKMLSISFNPLNDLNVHYV